MLFSTGEQFHMAKKDIHRKHITDRDRIDWALARYATFRKEGGFLNSLKMLAGGFGRSEAVISRGIQTAFARGLVKVIETKEIREVPPRNRHLEDLLLEQFAGLRTAIVIDVNAPPTTEEKLIDYDNDLHKKLGAALAEMIATLSLELDGKAIGLSSGRGVHHVVQELKKHKLKAHAVTLLSLTGDMYFPTSRTPYAPMDANRNVQDMCECLPDDTFFKTITAPLAPPFKDWNRFLRNTWLGEWKKNKPDYALIGVGVLHTGHRFWDYALTPPHEIKSRLDPIADTLRMLVASCNTIIKGTSNYYPVADIANHFFLVDPPKGISITKSQRTMIQKHISVINQHLINIQAAQLHDIPNLMLVAGTKKKVLATHQLLNNYNNLTCLTIDSEAAASLLELK